jgi:cyclopropane fatty-acyl-phospholipid synthase-like methyltransferase
VKAAGIDRRATIRSGDMRQLPFAPGEFDAIVSAYAIDHLNRDGIHQSLAEASRVLEPGGDFLLMVIGMDPGLHFGARQAPWWNGRLRETGFRVVEHGMRPATLYVLARKP